MEIWNDTHDHSIPKLSCLEVEVSKVRRGTALIVVGVEMDQVLEEEEERHH